MGALAGASLSAGRLGQELGLSSAAVTGLLDRLEASGLARRVRDPADRLRVLVELGDTAREFGREHLQELARRIERAIGELDHEGLVAVHRFLSVLTSADTETPTA